MKMKNQIEHGLTPNKHIINVNVEDLPSVYLSEGDAHESMKKLPQKVQARYGVTREKIKPKGLSWEIHLWVVYPLVWGKLSYEEKDEEFIRSTMKLYEHRSLELIERGLKKAHSNTKKLVRPQDRKKAELTAVAFRRLKVNIWLENYRGWLGHTIETCPSEEERRLFLQDVDYMCNPVAVGDIFKFRPEDFESPVCDDTTGIGKILKIYYDYNAIEVIWITKQGYRVREKADTLCNWRNKHKKLEQEDWDHKGTKNG